MRKKKQDKTEKGIKREGDVRRISFLLKLQMHRVVSETRSSPADPASHLTVADLLVQPVINNLFHVYSCP